MKITSYQVLLPAMFHFKHEDKSDAVFVYIDHKNHTIIVPDANIEDVEEFKRLAYQYIQDSSQKTVVPLIPKEGFSKMDTKYHRE